jgi:hypothetical protein
MRIELNNNQLQVVASKQSIISHLRAELNHAQEKMDLYVSGIATAKGVEDSFRYEIKDSAIVIEEKPVTDPE